MPVQHYRNEDEPGRGYLLATWEGELEPGDSLDITPDPWLAQVLLARGYDLTPYRLGIETPDQGTEAGRTRINGEFSGHEARIRLAALQVIPQRLMGEAKWQPAQATTVRWSSVAGPGQMIEFTADLSFDYNSLTWTAYDDCRPGSLLNARHREKLGPWLKLNWWASPRQTALPTSLGDRTAFQTKEST